MKLPLIVLILCAALIIHIESQVVLYPPKEPMVAKDYTDRAAYMAAIAAPAENGGALFTATNDTQAGPFKFHLEFPAPLQDQDIHSLNLEAIMETNELLNPPQRRRLQTEMKWREIVLESLSIPGMYNYFYAISIPDLESTWIKTDLTTKWKFSTVFKFYFKATEYNQNLLQVEVQCPVTLTRPKTVSGSYSSVKVDHLTSTAAGQVDIDLSITASLLPCTDEVKTAVNTCTKKTDADPTPEISLNSYGKFILFLDNSDFAGIYYLIKNKVEMKSDVMPFAADFTSAATAGPVTQGEMIFSLPMAIVGDPITVSAIATLSTTGTSRRMMQSAAAKATYAAADVGVSTGSAKATSGLSTYIMSIVLLLGMILIMI